jgi:UDP-N-acetylglucosamine acyltransferase
VEAYAVIGPRVTIGAECHIGPFAVIGAPPQHRGSYPSPITGAEHAHGVEVGDGCCVREYVQIHAGCVQTTRIGRRVLLMAGCHIAHDCHVADDATLGSFSILGGLTLIDRGATFGQGVVTHPWVLVGEGAMVGLNSSVLADVMPFAKVAGAPARALGMNQHRDPNLPTSYDATVLDTEVWNRWGDLGARRSVMREAWALL